MGWFSGTDRKSIYSKWWYPIDKRDSNEIDDVSKMCVLFLAETMLQNCVKDVEGIGINERGTNHLFVPFI